MSKLSRRKTQEEFMAMAARLNSQPKLLKLDDPRLIERLPEPLTSEMMYTPKEIVEDMLDLLPEEIWSDPNATFLDPVSKSGIFLDRAYFRLFNGLRKIIPDHYDRRRHIITKQLYGLVEYRNYLVATKMLLYGSENINDNNSYVSGYWEDGETHGNIKYFSLTLGGDDEQFKGKTISSDTIFKDIAKGEHSNGLWERFKKEVLKNMKFDVVVGNPPYNRGMDLDFVNLGFELCSRYCLMITPAKWQTAEAEQKIASKTINYGQFREKLVPHMSKVVFYPDCKDVFDIYQIDGITYYLLDKNNETDKCIVSNISKTRGNIVNSTTCRSIRDGESLINICNELISSIEPYDKFIFPYIQGDKRYNVVTNTQASGYDFFSEKKARFILGISRILDVKSGETHKGLSKVTFESDSRSECESFVSWLNTRFTRFFIIANMSKITVTDQHCFRFVPAPPSGKFDHIYTDEELYKAFNLPQKYIDVIEAVIKERK